MSAPAFIPTHRMLLAGLGLAAEDLVAAGGAEPVGVDRAFLGALIAAYAGSLPFDAAFYAAQVPDLDALIADGTCRDAHDHFLRIGYPAGLSPHRLAFDAVHYEATNPDLGGLRRQGGAMALVAHFLQLGQHEARSAHAATDAAARSWRLGASRADTAFTHRAVDGALVHAFRQPVVGPPGVGFRGGVALPDPEDTRLRHHRSFTPVDSLPNDGASVGALAGTWVYAGPACGHFGHAMSESLHRILPARALFGCRRLVFVGQQAEGGLAGFDALPAPLQAALRFLDVRPGEVALLQDDRVVERLLVVEQGADLGGGANASYLGLLNDFTPARLQALDRGAPDGGAWPRRLYVSRSKLRHGGIVLGEAYLEALLAGESWHVLHPQDHDLVTQMQFYRHAEIVVFLEGSAAHGIELFGARALNCVVLWPRRATSRHVFDPLLRPRARRMEVLPAARLLGSVAIDPASGVVADHLGVSLADVPAWIEAVRGLDFAALPGFDAGAYAAAARADFEAHVVWLRDTRFCPVAEDVVLALRAVLAGG